MRRLGRIILLVWLPLLALPTGRALAQAGGDRLPPGSERTWQPQPLVRGQSMPLISWLQWRFGQASANGAPSAHAAEDCPRCQPVPQAAPHEPGRSCSGACGPAELSCPGDPPRWYVMGELLPLRRDNGRSFDFASLGAGGPIVLSSANLEDDYEAGARVLVGRALGDWYRLEASWFGAYVWSDRAAVRNADANGLGGTGNLFSPFSNFGVPAGIDGLDFNELASISFSSKLNNVEINLRRAIALPPGPWDASFLVGFRYMKISEEFRYLTIANVPLPQGAVNDIAIQTDNDMVGIQIGLLSQVRLDERGWIDLAVKGAIFSNHADQNTVYVNTDNNGVVSTFVGGAEEDTAVYLGDLSLTFNYQLSPAWTFRIGYKALWLTGVALGADNFNSDVNLLRLGPALLDRRGRVAYHGPSIGLVWAR